MADVFTADNALDRLDLTIPFLSHGLRQVIEQLDLSVDGLQDLTSHASEQFNRQFPDHPDIRYFSYAGKRREGGKPCALLLPTHGLITLRTNQENDGMVSVDSARWGEGLVETWPADHADEIGHNLDASPIATPSSFAYLHKYQEIIQKLAAL